jgi:uncharacterized repeat protein (TIGR01451 family)
VYVLDLATGKVQSLSPPDSFDETPRWSPDGARIIFTRETADAQGNTLPRVWVMRADGGGATHIAGADASGFSQVDPEWSPDGKLIAYGNGSGQYFSIASADGTGAHRVMALGASGHPSWQPLGETSLDLTASPDPAEVNQPLTYTAMVTNTGHAPVSQATLRFTIPADVVVDRLDSGCSGGGTETVLCSLPDIAKGDKLERTLVVHPTKADTVHVDAQVSGPGLAAPEDAANDDQADCQFQDEVAGWTITAQCPDETQIAEGLSGATVTPPKDWNVHFLDFDGAAPTPDGTGIVLKYPLPLVNHGDSEELLRPVVLPDLKIGVGGMSLDGYDITLYDTGTPPQHGAQAADGGEIGLSVGTASLSVPRFGAALVNDLQDHQRL